MTTNKTSSDRPSNSIKRLYKEAVTSAVDAAGGGRAFLIVGSTMRKALVGSAILQILYIQDEEVVSPERIVEMLRDLRDMLLDDETMD